MNNERKISFEVEYPVVEADTPVGLSQDKFRRAWSKLGERGWDLSKDPANRLATGVVRKAGVHENSCLSSNQSISSDTGPLIELVTSPELNLHDLESQFTRIKKEAIQIIDSVGGRILSLGIHPYTSDSKEEYYQLRTPRSAYDYAIKQRGWPHEKLLNIAAIQEVVDVPTSDALLALRVLIRLGGLMTFIFRNAPDLHNGTGLLSVRPKKWMESVTSRIPDFKADVGMVNIPSKEITSWQDYFELLWNTNPMFLLGTKKHGLFYIPEHPTFWDFLSKTPTNGWEGVDILEQSIFVKPALEHVNCTDWTYFGMCRPRWRFKKDTNLKDLLKVFNEGNIGPFFEQSAEKIVIENRFNATGFSGEELSSLAFVVGLLENLLVAEQFVFQHNYEFWQEVFALSQTELLAKASVGGCKILSLVEQVFDIAQDGLLARGLGEEGFLSPVEKIVSSGVSRSETVRELFISESGNRKEKALALISRFTVK